jgi:hypothetical protein
LEFAQAALQALAARPDHQAAAMLAREVPLDDAILRAVCHPQLFTEKQTSDLLRILAGVHDQVDLKLLQILFASDFDEQPAWYERILAGVEQMAERPRVVAKLLQCYRALPYDVRPRLARLLAQKHPSRDWVRERLEDTDPRVRAAVVEAHWTPSAGWLAAQADSVFQLAKRDPHARVRARAAVGLCQLGSVEGLGLLADLATAARAEDRGVAFEMIAVLRDPRFHPLAVRAVADPDAAVRRVAFRCLAQLKKAREQRESTAGAISIGIARLEPHAEGQLRATLAIEESSRPVKGLRPLDFIITAALHPMFHYTVQEKSKPAGASGYELYFRPQPSSATMVEVKVEVLTEQWKGDQTGYCFHGSELEAALPLH